MCLPDFSLQVVRGDLPGSGYHDRERAEGGRVEEDDEVRHRHDKGALFAILSACLSTGVFGRRLINARGRSFTPYQCIYCGVRSSLSPSSIASLQILTRR